MRIKLSPISRERLRAGLTDSHIPISYFGGTNNTNARLYQNWNFLQKTNHVLPNTMNYLAEVFDLRLPIHFQSKDVDIIATSFLQIFEKILTEE